MTPIYGHNSPETAYVIDDYPYGFRLRCKMRCWIEYKAKKGFRFVTQTTNPKKPIEIWNKPKESTYSEMAGNMFLDDEGHVHWDGVGAWTKEVDVLKFILAFPDSDMTVLKLYAAARVNPKGLLAKLASGEVHQTMTVNGMRREEAPEELERQKTDARERLAVWMQIAEKLGVS